MEKYNEKRNEEGLKLYEDNRKFKFDQANNIIYFNNNIKIFVLFHDDDKEQVLEIESKLANRNIEFVNNLANVRKSSNRKLNLLKIHDYFVVILSKKCLEDYTLMEILVENFNISNNYKNKKILPIFIDKALYEPETREEIANSWTERANKFKERYSTGNYGDDTYNTEDKMRRIACMLRKFLVLAREKDIKSDEAPYLRLIKKIEENSGVTHERSGVMVNNTYNECQIINAKDHSTVTATQNNGINKDELKDIVDLIEANLEKLNQEQAEDLQDTLSMIVEEFSSETPRQGRLKKCLTLLAPMITVTNGIPILAENLQKVCDYILPYIK